MIIRSVKLQNFKSHLDSSISFSEGLNLIIGPNGSGKSSILEAIGLAFFGITNEKKLSQFITNEDSKNTALIKVDFVSDGIHFTITKEISSSQSRVKISDDTGLTVDGNAKVIEKMKQLFRIETDPEKIYKNVITSYQNQMTDIFAGRESERKNFFNALFDTEIYKKISSSHVKKYSDTLESNLNNLNNIASNLESEINERASLPDEIRSLEGEIKSKENEISAWKYQIEKLQKFLSDQIELKDRMNSMISQRKILESKLEGLNHELVNLNKSKSESENAGQVLILYRNDYVLYEEIYLKVQEENEKISRMRNALDEIQKVNKEISDKRLEIEKFSVSIASDKDRLKENDWNRQIYIDQLKSSQDRVRELTIQLEEQERVLKDLELEKKKFKEEMNTSLNLDVKELEDRLSEIRDKIAITNSKIKDLKSAKETLGNGICPYLKERCLNINGDPDRFFNPQIENSQSELLQFQKEKADIEEQINKIERYHEEIMNSIKVHLEEIEIKLRKIYEENAAKRSLINSEMQNQERIKKALEDLENSSQNLRSLIEKRDQKISELRSELEVLLQKTSNEEKIKLEIETLMKEYDSHREVLKKVKKGHDLYVENQKSAAIINEIISKIEERKSEIESIQSGIDQINSDLSKVKVLYDEEELKKTRETIENITSNMNSANMELGELRSDLKHKLDESHEIEKKRAKLEDVRSSIKSIKVKLEMAKNLRALLDQMGSQVSTIYRENISFKAMANHNLLTKRSETVLWDENYDLHLISKNGKLTSDRTFGMLSGGEQVALALAMRMAMATFFSRSGFAIFDEPTVNLDLERKNALSETLPDLIGEMDQVIVVTHDDTFREMTEKIISLKNIDGITTIVN
ncbi:AAA family ATPase [Athalassotoga saccharophila]|uniref:AAA family ATPase n=1 Tax=Athalassotoga saccharophila TaxID=1441386 RepID=UPI00137A0BD9|nr:SMC family ATPase [Athalassotoga saccharophila]BBJ28030.1 exonuclease SbcC [Athalassotoga saccharophila]